MHFELLLLVTGGRWTWRRGAWSRGLLNAGQICRFRWDSGQDSDQVGTPTCVLYLSRSLAPRIRLKILDYAS